jgi:glycopeptide antibiotics resistance protein
MFIDFELVHLHIGVATLAVLLVILRFQKRSWSYLFFFTIFGIYLLGVVATAVFPIVIPDPETLAQSPFSPSLNLIPFYFGACYLPELCLRNIFENIMLTVPFGFGVNFIARLKAKDFLWLPAAVGLALESIQLLISLAARSGFRVTDINDVLLNAAGVLIGYAFFRLFARIYLEITRRIDAPLGGIFVYIREITSRS